MKKNHDIFKVILLTIGIISIAFILFFLTGWTGRSEYVEVPYIVEPGDTLDGLYYKYGSGDLLKWRYEVKRINNTKDSGLYAGDEIIILVEAGNNNDND